MATAGGSGASGAAQPERLSADQLRGYLLTWGVDVDRVEQHSLRLAQIGVTLKGLAAVPQDVLLSLLIGKGVKATERDDYDAYVIMAGAREAAAAAGVVLLQALFSGSLLTARLLLADYVVMALVLLVLLQAALALVPVQANRAQRVRMRAKAKAACVPLGEGASLAGHGRDEGQSSFCSPWAPRARQGPCANVGAECVHPETSARPLMAAFFDVTGLSLAMQDAVQKAAAAAAAAGAQAEGR